MDNLVGDLWDSDSIGCQLQPWIYLARNSNHKIMLDPHLFLIVSLVVLR